MTEKLHVKQITAMAYRKRVCKAMNFISQNLERDLSLEEIAKLAALKGVEVNEAKKVLANEATTLLHGSDAARAAAETAQKTFEQGGAGDDLPTIDGKPGDGLLALFDGDEDSGEGELIPATAADMCGVAVVERPSGWRAASDGASDTMAVALLDQ